MLSWAVTPRQNALTAWQTIKEEAAWIEIRLKLRQQFWIYSPLGGCKSEEMVGYNTCLSQLLIQSVCNRFINKPFIIIYINSVHSHTGENPSHSAFIFYSKWNNRLLKMSVHEQNFKNHMTHLWSYRNPSPPRPYLPKRTPEDRHEEQNQTAVCVKALLYSLGQRFIAAKTRMRKESKYIF